MKTPIQVVIEFNWFSPELSGVNMFWVRGRDQYTNTYGITELDCTSRTPGR